MFQDKNSERRQNILKGFKEFDLKKSRSGVYKDTPENRKHGRVGQKYGSKKVEDQSKDNEFKKEVAQIEKDIRNHEYAIVRAKAYFRAAETESLKKTWRENIKDANKKIDVLKKKREELQKKTPDLSKEKDKKDAINKVDQTKDDILDWASSGQGGSEDFDDPSEGLLMGEKSIKESLSKLSEDEIKSLSLKMNDEMDVEVGWNRGDINLLNEWGLNITKELDEDAWYDNWED